MILSGLVIHAAREKSAVDHCPFLLAAGSAAFGGRNGHRHFELLRLRRQAQARVAHLVARIHMQ